MEKEKVYIVIEIQAFDYLITDFVRLVTTDKNKAMEEWKKILKSTIREYQNDYDLEDIVMDIDEKIGFFDFYKIGYSCELGNKCWIEEKEVN